MSTEQESNPKTTITRGESGLSEYKQAKEVEALEVQQSKIGRPTKYTTDIVASICEQLADGIPLTVICRQEGMPKARTVYDWMYAKPGVSADIARAREVGEDFLAADCLNIADDNGRDTRIVGEGVEVADSDWIQRAKLRIETRLKLLAKWNPKKYGDKIELEQSGEVKHTISFKR